MLGNGATFVLSSGSVGTVISLDPPEETLIDVPDDNLGTTDQHEFVPGEVAETTPLSGVAVFEGGTLPALGGTPVTGTLTYPLGTGQATGANYAGTGYFNRRKVTELTLDGRVLLEFAFKYDGKTGPTYTAGSA